MFHCVEFDTPPTRYTVTYLLFCTDDTCVYNVKDVYIVILMFEAAGNDCKIWLLKMDKKTAKSKDCCICLT